MLHRLCQGWRAKWTWSVSAQAPASEDGNASRNCNSMQRVTRAILYFLLTSFYSYQRSLNLLILWDTWGMFLLMCVNHKSGMNQHLYISGPFYISAAEQWRFTVPVFKDEGLPSQLCHGIKTQHGVTFVWCNGPRLHLLWVWVWTCE